MKHLLTLVFALHIGIANAQSTAWVEVEKSVICGPLKDFITGLSKDFKEYPVFLGADGKDDSKYSLFVNKDTGSWTIIQFNKTIACLLGTGSKGQLISIDKPTL